MYHEMAFCCENCHAMMQQCSYRSLTVPTSLCFNNASTAAYNWHMWLIQSCWQYQVTFVLHHLHTASQTYTWQKG